jgi:hypothetical protein
MTLANPILPDTLWCHLVTVDEVALEHLEARATIEAENVVGEDRFLCGYRWFNLDRFIRCLPNRGKRLMHLADQAR